jgi:hypothetical protein
MSNDICIIDQLPAIYLRVNGIRVTINRDLKQNFVSFFFVNCEKSLQSYIKRANIIASSGCNREGKVILRYKLSIRLQS